MVGQKNRGTEACLRPAPNRPRGGPPGSQNCRSTSVGFIATPGVRTHTHNISGGRLNVGVGRAFVPAEYAAYGLDMAESRARFDEGTDAIVRLWTEDRVSYPGRFWQFDNVHLAPRPCQSPHPPIWVAAVSSEESFVNAAKHGYHIMIVPFAGGFERCSKMIKTVSRGVEGMWAHARDLTGPDIFSRLPCGVPC